MIIKPPRGEALKLNQYVKVGGKHCSMKLFELDLLLEKIFCLFTHTVSVNPENGRKSK